MSGPEEGSREETPEGEGFYVEGMPTGDAPGSDATAAMRRRLVETLCRKPDDVRLWLQVLGLFSREAGSRDPKVVAENLKAVLEQLEGQLLPPE